jgi:regulator of sirC expression with transglutaminase-like and TPR domain
VLDLLAAAYATAGNFDRAVAVAQAALDLKPPDTIAAALRDRQQLYRHGQPFVAPQ